MAREAFLVNPARRGRRKSGRRNPYVMDVKEGKYVFVPGEGMVKKSKRRKGVKSKMAKAKRKSTKRSRAAKKAWRARKGGKKVARRRATKMPHRFKAKRVSVRKAKKGLQVTWKNAPRRRKRHNRARRRNFGELAVVGGNPRRRHYKRNPALSIGGLQIKKNLPFVATGAVSAIAVTFVPAITGLSAKGPIYKYGAQLATAIGGGMLVGKFVGRSHGTVWMIVGASVVLADVLKTYVLTGLGLSDYMLEAFPDSGEEEMSAYEMEDYGDAYGEITEGDELEAFPQVLSESPYSAY